MATFGTTTYADAQRNQMLCRKPWPRRGYLPLPAGVEVLARNYYTGEALPPFTTQADGMWEVEYPGVDRIDVSTTGKDWTGPVDPVGTA